LHQQKFLVVSVLSNSPWLPRNLKNIQNETIKLFSAVTQILTFQPIKADFVYEVLRNYPKTNKFCSWNQQSRLKC